MEVLIADLLSQPSDGVDTYIKKLRSKSDLIAGAAGFQVGDSTALLEALKDVHVPHCSAGYALFLSFQTDVLPDAAIMSFLAASNFFFAGAVKASVCFVPEEVAKIARKVAQVAIAIRKPRAVITLLMSAAQLMAPTSNCITPAHSLVLQMCIKGQLYDTAVNFMAQHEILEVNVKVTALQSADFLQYFYYAGICYTALKDYPSALASFFQCIATPAHSLSKIVVCAVKKARLIALIHYGRELVVSCAVSGVVSRFLKQPLPAYDAIVKAFTLNDKTGLVAAMESGAEQLNQDQNFGLAQRALEAHTRHQLKRLSATFISLSLTDVARRAELPSAAAAEQYLVQLSSEGEISVRINATTGFVTFEEETSAASTAQGSSSASSGVHSEEVEAARRLQQFVGETALLAEKLREMQRQAVVSPKYALKNLPSYGRAQMMQGMGVSSLGMGGAEYQHMDLS